MRDMTDNQFRKIAETRKAQMRAWKAIPESKRPTWEQFKRGLEVKEHSVLNQNVSPTTVKLKGPNGTTKEISLDEWNSYTPLNRHAQRVASLSHTLMELDEVEARNRLTFTD